MNDPTVSMVIDRSVITTASLALYRVMNDPATTAEQRDEARVAYDALEYVALYNENDAAVSLAPVSFWWFGHYMKSTEEFLARLPEEVTAECPGRVRMAREAAQLVDKQAYSVDYRLEALSSLGAILDSLRGAAADAELVEMMTKELEV